MSADTQAERNDKKPGNFSFSSAFSFRKAASSNTDGKTQNNVNKDKNFVSKMMSKFSFSRENQKQNSPVRPTGSEGDMDRSSHQLISLNSTSTSNSTSSMLKILSWPSPPSQLPSKPDSIRLI